MGKYQLPEGQKLATFKIDESDWEAFKTLCEGAGTSASRTLISFIEQSLAAGKIDESLLPKPKSSIASDVNLDELEARLMARFEARLSEVIEKKLSPSLPN